MLPNLKSSVKFGQYPVHVREALRRARYYVSPTGNNSNPGIFSSPKLTLKATHDLAKPNNVIVMRGGTYSITQQFVLSVDGQSGAPIIVTAFPGEVPVLDATAMSSAFNDDYSNGFVWEQGGDWNWFWGLEVTMGRMGGIFVQPGAVPVGDRLWGCDIHHNGRGATDEGKGATIASGTNWIIEYCDFHHNRNELGANAYKNSDGLFIGAGLCSGAVVRYNRAYDNGDDGFDFYNLTNNAPGNPAQIYDNWAWGNGFRNDARTLTGGDGNGFKLGGGDTGVDTRTSGGHAVARNLTWKNRTFGMHTNDATLNCSFDHNTGYLNLVDEFGTWGESHTYRNNIAVPNGVSIAGTQTTNSWQVGGADASDFASVDDTIAIGPRNPFTKGLPQSPFLHLASGSNLINAGTDIGYGHLGSAPDLGAYERE